MVTLKQLVDYGFARKNISQKRSSIETVVKFDFVCIMNCNKYSIIGKVVIM